MLPGGLDSGSVFVEKYWPWVGGICRCLGSNARGFARVNHPGWPLISALYRHKLLLEIIDDL